MRLIGDVVEELIVERRELVIENLYGY